MSVPPNQWQLLDFPVPTLHKLLPNVMSLSHSNVCPINMIHCKSTTRVVEVLPLLRSTGSAGPAAGGLPPSASSPERSAAHRGTDPGLSPPAWIPAWQTVWPTPGPTVWARHTRSWTPDAAPPSGPQQSLAERWASVFFHPGKVALKKKIEETRNKKEEKKKTITARLRSHSPHLRRHLLEGGWNFLQPFSILKFKKNKTKQNQTLLQELGGLFILMKNPW